MLEDTPERPLRNISNRTSERTPEGMPDRSPHRMLEGMSEPKRMSEFHEFCYVRIQAPGRLQAPRRLHYQGKEQEQGKEQGKLVCHLRKQSSGWPDRT